MNTVCIFTIERRTCESLICIMQQRIRCCRMVLVGWKFLHTKRWGGVNYLPKTWNSQHETTLPCSQNSRLRGCVGSATLDQEQFSFRLKGFFKACFSSIILAPHELNSIPFTLSLWEQVLTTTWLSTAWTYAFYFRHFLHCFSTHKSSQSNLSQKVTHTVESQDEN